MMDYNGYMFAENNGSDNMPVFQRQNRRRYGEEKKKYIDIHTHILPGIDDGSRDFETSVRMLRDAWADGTGAVICTPHYKQKYACGNAENIKECFLRFKESVAEIVPVSLYLGTEAMYEIDLPKKIQDGELHTMAGSSKVLIEFFPSVNYEYLCNGVFEMMRYGYIPILAHIERYGCLTLNRVAELADMGALMQINARSVLGRSGFRIKHFCHSILKAGYVDFVASDAHDLSVRSAQLNQCAKYLEARWGKNCADTVLSNKARDILALHF